MNQIQLESLDKVLDVLAMSYGDGAGLVVAPIGDYRYNAAIFP
jgi:hypothetical protein